MSMQRYINAAQSKNMAVPIVTTDLQQVIIDDLHMIIMIKLTLSNHTQRILRGIGGKHTLPPALLKIILNIGEKGTTGGQKRIEVKNPLNFFTKKMPNLA